MNNTKSLILVGAGGFGAEVYEYILSDINKGHIKDIAIKGFLDDDKDSLNKKSLSKIGLKARYLGSENDYLIAKNDLFLITVGNVQKRKKITQKLEQKGAKFFSFIHSSSIVHKSALIEQGVIICPFSIVTAKAVVKAHSILNLYTYIAHDSCIGKYSIISPYATLNGNVKAGDELFMGTRASILLGLKVGKRCTISAGITISKDLQDNTFVPLQDNNKYLLKNINKK